MKTSQEILSSGLGSERFDHQQNYPEGGAGGEQSLSALPGKSECVIRMWDRGPLRQFSNKQAKSHYVAYSSPVLKGYAGSYVCDLCQMPCSGVYRAQPLGIWVCGGCKGRDP